MLPIAKDLLVIKLQTIGIALPDIQRGPGVIRSLLHMPSSLVHHDLLPILARRDSSWFSELLSHITLSRAILRR